MGYVEQERAKLAELTAELDELRAARNMAYEPAPEDALTKWKREGEATKRNQERARAAMKADEARIIRERQQAAESAALREMPEA
jgi:hypothetical protein